MRLLILGTVVLFWVVAGFLAIYVFNLGKPSCKDGQLLFKGHCYYPGVSYTQDKEGVRPS